MTEQESASEERKYFLNRVRALNNAVKSDATQPFTVTEKVLRNGIMVGEPTTLNPEILKALKAYAISSLRKDLNQIGKEHIAKSIIDGKPH